MMNSEDSTKIDEIQTEFLNYSKEYKHNVKKLVPLFFAFVMCVIVTVPTLFLCFNLKSTYLDCNDWDKNCIKIDCLLKLYPKTVSLENRTRGNCACSQIVANDFMISEEYVCNYKGESFNFALFILYPFTFLFTINSVAVSSDLLCALFCILKCYTKMNSLDLEIKKYDRNRSV